MLALLAALETCSTKGCWPPEGALEAVAFPLMSLEGLGGGAVEEAPEVLAGGAPGAALEGWARGASGGGMRMVRGEGGALGASPVLEPSGAEDSGAEVVFSRTGGAKGSARPAASSSPAPVLLAPVSWCSGRKERSSSVR
jgi:hypothetical protein